MVHKPPVVKFKNPSLRQLSMGVTIPIYKVIHMCWPGFDFLVSNEDIEFRFEAPDNVAGFDRLSSVDAYALDCAFREIGADKHHDWLDPNDM